jgi:hypothetical protein
MSFKLKFPSILKGCVLHAPLDEESYNPATRRLTDKSAFGNHGTSAVDASFATDRKGQVNRACAFDGTTDHIDCGNGSSLQIADTDFSICGWVKSTQVPASERILASMGFIMKHGASRFSVALNDGTSSGWVCLTAPNLLVGVWYHFMYTADRLADIKIYTRVLTQREITYLYKSYRPKVII